MTSAPTTTASSPRSHGTTCQEGADSWLITDDTADLTGWLSPDGTVLLVERNDDGASTLALHDAAPAVTRDLPLPSTGSVNVARLPTRDGRPIPRRIALSVSSAELPGDALL